MTAAHAPLDGNAPLDGLGTPEGVLDLSADHPGYPAPSAVSKLLALPLIALVHLYRGLISGFFPGACRFYPSCSMYGLTALRRYGAFRGGYLVVRRLLRCNPWNPGGVDNVPRMTRAPAEDEPLREQQRTDRL